MNCCQIPNASTYSENLQICKNGFHLTVLGESPTKASTELGIPFVGRTGVSLCRIFKRLKDLRPDVYKDLCIRNITLVNAVPEKVANLDGDDGGEEYEKWICEILKYEDTIICVGDLARKRLDELDQIEAETIVQICHLSDRGLSKLSNWHPKIPGKDRRKDRRAKASVAHKLDVIASWIDQCLTRKGWYDITQFERYYQEEILRYLPQLPNE